MAPADEAARLAHDLRSPLVVVEGFAALLAGDEELSDEQRRDYAARIVAAAAELRALVDAAGGSR
jgi:signal transduction histidine kinase